MSQHMQTNPYSSPAPDAPVKANELARWLSLVCMALATYCGLFFVKAAVAARVTMTPPNLPMAGLGALGIMAWTIAGLALQYRYRVATSVAWAVGLIALALLVL